MSDLFFLFLMLSALSPVIRQKLLEAQRIQLMRQIERKRSSRLITMIHRQEMFSFLGIPFSRFINIEDSEQILRAIRLTDDKVPIDLVLHTPGGLVLAAEQIAWALAEHPAKVTVFVPHYAMSGGTLIALAADEIVMDRNAVLGPVDPQLGQYAAASILRVRREKSADQIKDETLILADLSEKALAQVEDSVTRLLLRKGHAEKKAHRIAHILSTGIWTHDYPIRVEVARELGLSVSTEMPEEIYGLMELYPQPPRQQPSVQYIPLPYQQPGERSVPSSNAR